MSSTKRRTAVVVVAGAFALLATTVTAGSQEVEKRRVPDRWVIPGDAVFPEGVAYQKATRDFYVGSTTDGTIYRADTRDREMHVFLPGGGDGRTAATGLKTKNGRLYVSGAATGQVFVYSTDDGHLLASYDNGLDATFVNDVAVTPDGAAYFTDSLAPYLYRVARQPDGTFSYERWLDFTGTPLTYQPGFNVNGIAASADGRYLVVIHSARGELYRIDVATREVRLIDTGGEPLTAGDGIVLSGTTLYVVRNSFGEIVELHLADDLLSGVVLTRVLPEGLAFPTTAALTPGRSLLIVNAQFDRRETGPVLPFTVSRVKAP